MFGSWVGTICFWLGLLLLPVLILALMYIHLLAVMLWSDQATKGLSYYGKSRQQRLRFRRWLGIQRLLLLPILWLIQRGQSFRFADASFQVAGLAGPKGTCSPESFELGMSYLPTEDDIFVASQMKSGTTWLQQIVVQVLTRGSEDFASTGKAMYALSPWLESEKSVALEQAPLLGNEKPSRVIKTHLPTSHCPYDAVAKYICVTRHPVSCFASCVDFVSSNLGPFAPPVADFETWFCSEDMWWGDWASHVQGWTQWAEQRDNVLLLSFEEMKADLTQVVDKVNDFLGLEALEPKERECILQHCSFDYMRANADCFEMNPPHILQNAGQFLVSGKANRFQDVSSEMAERIEQWCQQQRESLRPVPVQST